MTLGDVHELQERLDDLQAAYDKLDKQYEKEHAVLEVIASYAGHRDRIPHRLGEMASSVLWTRTSNDTNWDTHHAA